MIISIKNISKSYANINALLNVSIDLNEGDIVGLIGENGAGKTTLLKIIDTGTLLCSQATKNLSIKLVEVLGDFFVTINKH